jgi:hypothetical protein
MKTDWQRIAAARARDELAARKRNDEQHRDPELEAAFVAWYSHRLAGGDMTFDEFRREYLAGKEGHDGR